MGALPMERAAGNALRQRDDFRAAGDLDGVELVEMDCVTAVKRLLRDGSPLLRRALINAVLGARSVLSVA